MEPNTPTGGLEALVQKHDFTLYGVDGRNGLYGTTNELVKKVNTIDRKLIIMCAVAAATGNAGMQLLGKLIS